MRRARTSLFLASMAFVAAMAGSPDFARAANLPPASCQPDPVFAELAAQPELVQLGRDLFYDPILSGSGTVACATCHHPAFGTSDGVALSFGDGGVGLGPGRQVDPKNPPEQRIPRNAQGLFNLGYREFSVLFHDGRVERLADGQIRTPLGPVDDGSSLGPLAQLTRFPVTSADEMAGHYSENPIAAAVRRGQITGPGGAHDLIAQKVWAIPGYGAQFERVFGPGDSRGYDEIGQALAAFMAVEWRADNSAFDRHLCEGVPLAAEAAAGRDLFYGKAGCADCHAGRFQTDHDFHAIAIPQIGPGKAERFETHARDLGRMRVTGAPEDAYGFRTPSLRNVALTAPYGHSGAYATLADVIRHHLDPARALATFDRGTVVLPVLAIATDFRALDDKAERDAIAAASVLPKRPLSEGEVAALLAFMDALTDPAGADGTLGVPDTVPSGLPVPQP